MPSDPAPNLSRQIVHFGQHVNPDWLLMEADMATVTSERALDQLAAQVHGSVLRPTDAAYEPARRIFNGMVDRRPRVIVQALGAGDVMQAVRFGREANLRIAVRGGGHNVAGHAMCEDGLLIDLSRLRSVRVDPKRGTALADPGCTYTDFDLSARHTAW